MALTYRDHKFRDFPNGPNTYLWWCDFDTEEDEARFTKTALSSGTGVMTVDENFGVYRQSGAATTDDSGSQLQGDMEHCSLNASKRLSFVCRGAKCSDGTQDEFMCGLCITDTTLLDATGTLAAGLTFTDGIGFYKPDGEANVYGFIRRDSVQLATGAYAITSTSHNVFSFEVAMGAVAGTGTVTFFVNGIRIGSLDSTTIPYDSEEILTPSLAFNTGNATGTKTCDWDCVGVEIER